MDWESLVLGPVQDAFAESVTYFPASGGSIALMAIPDDPTVEVQMQSDGPPITTNIPTLGVRLSDFGGYGPVRGDKLIIASAPTVTWIVRDTRPDGKGWSILKLNKSAA